MTRPYSLDLRERMVRAVEAGASRRATAAKFDVSPSCVVKLLQRWRQRGTLEPDPVSGGRRAKLADHAERVEALLAATPDLTIAELRTRLAADGIAVSPAAISRFLKACGLTRKKRPRTPPSRTAPMSPPPGVPGARSSRR
jgi:transposase